MFQSPTTSLWWLKVPNQSRTLAAPYPRFSNPTMNAFPPERQPHTPRKKARTGSPSSPCCRSPAATTTATFPFFAIPGTPKSGGDRSKRTPQSNGSQEPAALDWPLLGDQGDHGDPQSVSSGLQGVSSPTACRIQIKAHTEPTGEDFFF